MYIDDNWLLESSSLPVHLPFDLVFSSQIGDHGKLNGRTLESKHQLIENEHFFVEEDVFVKVYVLLDHYGLMTCQNLFSTFKVKLRLVKLSMDVLHFKLAFESRKDFNCYFDPGVDLDFVICSFVKHCTCPDQARSN